MSAPSRATRRPGVSRSIEERHVTSTPAYTRRHLELLKVAAALIAKQGFHDTSMRSLATAADRSLAGLYYYFATKEELLFQIQHHCYSTLLQAVEEIAIDAKRSPQKKLIAFIGHHITYFRYNMNEMKVLAHEDLTLGGEKGRRLLEIKRAYAQILVDIVAAHATTRPDGVGKATPEVAAFMLFGMMNWLYTWPRRLRERPAEELAMEMAQLFLCGFPGCPTTEISGMRDTVACPPRAFWKKTS